MLEGILTLGRAYLERLERQVGKEKALLQSLVQVDDVLSGQGKENDESKLFLVHLHIRQKDGKWRLEVGEIQEASIELLYESLWIGHADRKRFQDRATVMNKEGLAMLISQALPVWAGYVGPGLPDKGLRQEMRLFVDTICQPLPTASKQSNYRWIWNLPKLGWDIGATFRSLDQANSKTATKNIAKILDKQIRTELNIPTKSNILYTLHFNNIWLPQHPAYQHYLYKRFVEDLFAGNNNSGYCHICGQYREHLTADTTRLRFKFYITDKPGFASGFRKENFYRNYRLCPECYQILLAGEAFLRTRLRSWLGTQVYVVPVFHLPQVRPRAEDLEAWAEYIVDRWQASLTLQGWQAFQQKLAAYRRFEDRKAAFLLDFLFVEGDERSIKLQHDIRDVPPSRLDELDAARQRTRALAEETFAAVNPWDLGLQVIFYLFPIGQRGQGRKAFFQFLEALLTQRPLRFRNLIPLFLETASIHRFEKYGAYVHRPPKPAKQYSKQEAALREMRKSFVQTQLLRIMLKHLAMLIPSGGVSMAEAAWTDEVRRLVPSDVWAYMEALDLNLAERALFLLGMLVGEVALRQQTMGSTPILNKIHFQGMDANKVRRLSNEILEQMRIYKALNPRTKDLFAAMRVLMDQARSLLSPAENTYWVLSGYAFRHLQRFGQGPSESSAEQPQA